MTYCEPFMPKQKALQFKTFSIRNDHLKSIKSLLICLVKQKQKDIYPMKIIYREMPDEGI